jgi:hypothetical protein
MEEVLVLSWQILRKEVIELTPSHLAMNRLSRLLLAIQRLPILNWLLSTYSALSTRTSSKVGLFLFSSLELSWFAFYKSIV